MTGLDLPPAEELSPAAHAALLYRHVVELIVWAQDNDPRTLQTAIGPSEIGHPCSRRIAFRLLAVPERNRTDRWRTTVGQAVHAWMADVMAAANERAGGGRYLVEHRVKPGNGPGGSSDLFVRGPSELDAAGGGHIATVLDRLSGTVTDWKVVGASSLSRYRRKGPSRTYRVQFHTYGYGMECAGERVEWVSMVCLPQSGTLADAVVWSERYDRQVALDALRRVEDITESLASLDVEHHPELMAAIPATPELCAYCPWFVPGSLDLARGCPGDHPAAGTPPRADRRTA